MIKKYVYGFVSIHTLWIISALFSSSFLIESVQCDLFLSPSILVDTSECADIADVLDGNRTIVNGLPNVLRLNTEHNMNVGGRICNVNYVFLDVPRGDAYTTCYGNDNDPELIFDRNKMLFSQKEQNAVVSCEQTSGTNDCDLLDISTDFGFILKEQSRLNSVQTLECGKGYCLVRIVTQGCLNSKYILRNHPSSRQSTMKWLKLIMSMFGSASSMFRIQSFALGGEEDIAIGTGVFMGLDTTTFEYEFKGTCRNEQNLPCDPTESNKYGSEVLTGVMLVMASPENKISFKDAQKIDGTDDEYILNFFYKSTGFGNSLMIQSYINQTRLCARGLEPTGLFNTFIDMDGFYKISCVVCEINAYYSESKISAPFCHIANILHFKQNGQ